MNTALRAEKTASESTAKNQALFICLSAARTVCVPILFGPLPGRRPPPLPIGPG